MRLSSRGVAFTVAAGFQDPQETKTREIQRAPQAVVKIYKICPASALARGGTAGHLPGQRGRCARRLHPLLHRCPGSRDLAQALFRPARAVLVEVDGDVLGSDLRWERSRNDELFPHLYGELDVGAVLSVMNLNMRSDGGHDTPELLP